MALLTAPTVRAEAPPPPDEAQIEKTVESGREALDQGVLGRVHPWYDSDADQVRRIQLRPERATSSSGGLSLLPELLKGAAWVLLFLFLAGIAWFLIAAYLRRDRSLAVPTDIDSLADRGSDVDRVEALPFRINRQTSDLLSEARRCYEAGDFNEAVIYLFSHQLVELDRHQVVRLARGKTNRQLVREILPRRPLMQLVNETMVAFEDVFFGNHSLGRARFESCWFRLDEFHRLLQETSR